MPGFASTKDAATCDEASTSDAKTDDPSRPWFGSGKRNAGITGAVPYDAAGYTIREVDSTVPEGFDHVDDWTISADDLVDGTTKYYSVIDKTLNSRIQIVKTDAETGNTVPLSGFKFQVLDSDGNTMSFADPYDANGHRRYLHDRRRRAGHDPAAPQVRQVLHQGNLRRGALYRQRRGRRLRGPQGLQEGLPRDRHQGRRRAGEGQGHHHEDLLA